MSSAESTDSGVPEEFAPGLLDQIFELWVVPEMARRGLALNPLELQAALVVMPPEGKGKLQTLLNDEAKFVALGKTTRAVTAGEALTEADLSELSDLRPVDIDPDAGWVGFFVFRGLHYIAFDFRRNKARAERLLELARSYHAVARLAWAAGHPSPTVENLFCAAELAVKAEMNLHVDAPPKDHIHLRRSYKNWSDLGNTRPEYSTALAQLASARKSARYGDARLKLGRQQIEELVRTVEALIEHARARAT